MGPSGSERVRAFHNTLLFPIRASCFTVAAPPESPRPPHATVSPWLHASQSPPRCPQWRPPWHRGPLRMCSVSTAPRCRRCHRRCCCCGCCRYCCSAAATVRAAGPAGGRPRRRMDDDDEDADDAPRRRLR
eukprot:gene14549-biopygen11161